MAIANLQGLSKPDDVAYAWAKFLVDDIIEQREAQVRPVLPGVYVFELDDDGAVSVPTMPILFDPEKPESLVGILDEYPRAFAYLGVMSGLPLPKVEWTGQAPTEAKKQMLGVPAHLIEPGTFPWYLMATFVSPSTKVTICAPFNGEKFGKVLSGYGLYGGALTSIFGDN